MGGGDFKFYLLANKKKIKWNFVIIKAALNRDIVFVKAVLLWWEHRHVLLILHRMAELPPPTWLELSIHNVTGLHVKINICALFENTK